MKANHQALNCQTLNKMNRAWKKLLQEKRMSVSFMKMNNSLKRRRRQLQKKLEKVFSKHLQKQVKELSKQIIKRIQKEKRTRPSGSETMNYLCEKAENNLEIKKKESKIRRMQEERLRVSSENQLHLFDQVIIDQ